jgi:hypothetical protein
VHLNVNHLCGDFRTIVMTLQDQSYTAEIPAEDVDAAWDMMAYVTVQEPGGDCLMFPGVYHPQYPYPYAVIETKA